MVRCIYLLVAVSNALQPYNTYMLCMRMHKWKIDNITRETINFYTIGTIIQLGESRHSTT